MAGNVADIEQTIQSLHADVRVDSTGRFSGRHAACRLVKRTNLKLKMS
jgi:hypothetical protein